MNPGGDGCPGNPRGMVVQIRATWFPRDRTPHSFIQGFPLDSLDLSEHGESPFHFRIGENQIGENACRGRLEIDGRQVSCDLRYRSTFRVTLSSKGWIGRPEKTSSKWMSRSRDRLRTERRKNECHNTDFHHGAGDEFHSPEVENNMER